MGLPRQRDGAPPHRDGRCRGPRNGRNGIVVGATRAILPATGGTAERNSRTNPASYRPWPRVLPGACVRFSAATPPAAGRGRHVDRIRVCEPGAVRAQSRVEQEHLLPKLTNDQIVPFAEPVRIPVRLIIIRCGCNYSVVFSLETLNLYRDSLLFRGWVRIFFTD